MVDKVGDHVDGHGEDDGGVFLVANGTEGLKSMMASLSAD